MEMLTLIYVYIYAAINPEARTKKFSVRIFWVTAIRERNKRRSVCVIHMNASNTFFYIFVIS